MKVESVSNAPFFHLGLDEGLKEVLGREKPESKKSSLEDVFADKCKTSKAGVKALLNEIRLRQEVNLRLLNNIENDISEQNSQLMALENLRYFSSFDLLEGRDQKKVRLKENILELEREKRREYLECWKDLMFLRKYLQISLRDYWNHARKRDVLCGNAD